MVCSYAFLFLFKLRVFISYGTIAYNDSVVWFWPLLCFNDYQKCFPFLAGHPNRIAFNFLYEIKHSNDRSTDTHRNNENKSLFVFIKHMPITWRVNEYNAILLFQIGICIHVSMVCIKIEPISYSTSAWVCVAGEGVQ